jgi:prepilin-type processing-associated H-X9-DG protein
MDRTQNPHDDAANYAWFDSGLPDMGPFARETATSWEQPEPSPLPQDEEELDGVIFAALVSPYA